jgi:hypothetical protein
VNKKIREKGEVSPTLQTCRFERIVEFCFTKLLKEFDAKRKFFRYPLYGGPPP